MTLSKNPLDETFPKYTELFSIPNSSSKPWKNPMGSYFVLYGSSVNMCQRAEMCHSVIWITDLKCPIKHLLIPLPNYVFYNGKNKYELNDRR